MDNEITIHQNATLGSQGNTFIGEQHNYTGLSIADATKMAFSMFREYYPQLRKEALDDVSQMLSAFLRDIPQENIIPPTPKIAVPVLQNASITEETELREYYARLLASSMDSRQKKFVHPSYVEIISQLCTDEAKILRHLMSYEAIPTITLRYESGNGYGIDAVKFFSDVGIFTHCEYPYNTNQYFDNLARLGLLEKSIVGQHLQAEFEYGVLKKNEYIASKNKQSLAISNGCKETKIIEGYVRITDFGKSFCRVCIPPSPVNTVQIHF